VVVLLAVLGGTFEVESNKFLAKAFQPLRLRLRGSGVEALEERDVAVWVKTGGIRLTLGTRKVKGDTRKGG